MHETEKLRVLIPHWITHNQEHANEFRTWAQNDTDAQLELLSAADAIEQANQALEKALKKLGGALEVDFPHTH